MYDENPLVAQVAQLLNNGFSFEKFLTKQERLNLISELIYFYDKKHYGAYEENEMIYIIDNTYKSIMMMEVTRNSIYFNPYDHDSLLDVIYVTLEFINEKFGPVEKPHKDIEDQETEEMPKPKPNFDILWG